MIGQDSEVRSVRNEHECDAASANGSNDGFDDLLVEGREGFVDKKKIRLLCERTGNEKLLAEAPRKAAFGDE